MSTAHARAHTCADAHMLAAFMHGHCCMHHRAVVHRCSSTCGWVTAASQPWPLFCSRALPARAKVIAVCPAARDLSGPGSEAMQIAHQACGSRHCLAAKDLCSPGSEAMQTTRQACGGRHCPNFGGLDNAGDQAGLFTMCTPSAALGHRRVHTPSAVSCMPCC